MPRPPVPEGVAPHSVETTMADTNDPLGQRGYIGWSMRYTGTVEDAEKLFGPLPLEDMPRPPAPEGAPTCRVCGCWEYGACWDDERGVCWWVEPDLCSHCEEKTMPEPRVRLWVAEFTGPHIEGTAYLALPKKQGGFETPYILESVVEAEASRMWDFITTSLCDLAEALPGGKDHPVEQERLAIIAKIKERTE